MVQNLKCVKFQFQANSWKVISLVALWHVLFHEAQEIMEPSIK